MKTRRLRISHGYGIATPRWDQPTITFGEYDGDVMKEAVITINEPSEARSLIAEARRILRHWQEEANRE